MSAEFQGAAFPAAPPAHPEQWELFELLTEGTTELNAHVKAHVATGCPSCGKHLADIRTLSKAREMKEEFDAFFDELPADDAPADEQARELSGVTAQRRRELSRYVLAVVVVCLGILGASAAQIG